MVRMPQIRPFAKPDTADLYEVCLRTGDDGDDASAQYADRAILGEVYVGPYLAFEPAWAWVVEHDGRVAGYVLRARYPLGAFPDASADAEIVRLIHDPRESAPGLLQEFPAHLHIDLLPHVQGHGLGGALIGILLDELRSRGVPGIHLGVSSTNARWKWYV